MKHEKLKVGDVLRVLDLKTYNIIIWSIVHFQQDVYFNCMFFCDYRGLERTENFLVTLKPEDLEIHNVTKIEI